MLALNPFLLDFQRIIVSKSYGVLYACADDLGSSLLKIASLVATHRVFQVMGKVAGLFLNPSKCVIIPLVSLSSKFYFMFLPWLVSNIP